MYQTVIHFPQKIPEMMRVGQEAVIRNPKENDPKSIRKFISKMRLQVLNDHRKNAKINRIVT